MAAAPHVAFWHLLVVVLWFLVSNACHSLAQSSSSSSPLLPFLSTDKSLYKVDNSNRSSDKNNDDDDKFIVVRWSYVDAKKGDWMGLYYHYNDVDSALNTAAATTTTERMWFYLHSLSHWYTDGTRRRGAVRIPVTRALLLLLMDNNNQNNTTTTFQLHIFRRRRQENNFEAPPLENAVAVLSSEPFDIVSPWYPEEEEEESIPPSSNNDNTTDAAAVTFYMVGDVPYSDMEACMLPFELDKLNTALEEQNALFLVHMGDIRAGRLDPITGEVRDCPESVYVNVTKIFHQNNNSMPTFFLPGDNGWLDCANPVEAYGYWEQYLFQYNDNNNTNNFTATVHRWDGFPTGVTRSTHRPEFFSFVISNILFVGLSLPGSGRNTDPHPWEPRDELLQDNVIWTRDNFNHYYSDNNNNNNVTLRAAVIMGHSTSSINDAYFDDLERLARDEHPDLPILVLEDGHYFQRQVGFRGAPNMMRIASDDTVTPMTITVDPTNHQNSNNIVLTDIFRYDRRCPCSTDHTPTRYVTYAPGDPCAEECLLPQTTCQDENPCFPGLDVC